MARTRYKFYEDEYPYFMTCTINAWLPVFTRPASVEIIYDSWRYLQRERGFLLLGYVILENHLHLIASAPNISRVMQSFKSYTAKRIIELLEDCGAQTILRQLKANKLRHKTESDYQVWQEGSKPKQIDNDNPVKRGYVDDPLHWRYSSARNYAGQPGLIEVVTDWM